MKLTTTTTITRTIEFTGDELKEILESALKSKFGVTGTDVEFSLELDCRHDYLRGGTVNITVQKED